MNQFELIAGEDLLDTIKRCGGYYACPRDADGKRLGPLVGYAGRDDQNRQLVGDVYVNFAQAERHGIILALVAQHLREALDYVELTGFCGAPEGGRALAAVLAARGSCQHIYPERKVLRLATLTSREDSELIFSRHEIEPDERWVIVEDVCNNFSTTAKLIAKINAQGATVEAIVCFLNRSPVLTFELDADFRLDQQPASIPVIAAVHNPFPQYRQDDSAVAEDVAAGNVVWKPKNDWNRLAEAMARAR